MLPHREGSCTNSTSVSSCLRQCGHLLLLFLKLKAWRFVFIVVPLLLLVSNLLVLPWLVRLVSVKEIKKHLVFYGARDFASSQAKVLIDRSAFNNEAVSASSIIANGGGHDSWIEDCRPLINCKERFIHQTDAAIVAHLRYSSTPESARSVLDCLDRDSSHLMCAFLYYVMVNSMHPRSQHQTMKTVQLFEMHNNRQLERLDEDRSLENAKLNLSLPLSACTGWINEGLFARLVEFGAAYLVAFAAIGVTFYLLISTISCIHILKTDGFLQQLFRSGLSVSAYWLAVWIITLVECLVFAGVFTASNAMQCPGVYSAAAIAQTFTFAVLFCLNLAASMLLLKTLLPSMLMTSILAMLLNAGLVLAFSNHEYLVRKASFVPYLFPPMFGKEYLAGRLSSEVERLRTGLNLPEDEAGRFSNIIAANIVSLLLQMLLLAYLDFLVKNGNGLCLPPCYPIMIEFWLPRLLQDQGKASSDRSDVAESEPHIEPVMGMAQIVVVDEVSKSYCDCWACCDETPHVLKHVTCRIYRGQITALIGHNGAGKSTLIKILTGEELPDTGTAHIDGCLVTNPLLRLALRGRISICPQFDALCDSLTVMECIRVTLTSRAVSDSSQLERARGMLQRLGLGDKENVLSCDLSGGQKRKVSTILALLGDPDVVFLDEPTSGLDPVSRRQLWQLLQEEKSSRSIILCTQFMDEADILADRKIFLCGGQIVCAGSSMFLKRAFGCSFILNVSLKTKAAARTLLAKLNQVRVKSLVETELQLEIPSLNSAVLTEAIQVLETSEEIVAFGLSQASLDDIFMRLSGMDSDDIIKAFPLGTLTLSQTPELSENSAPDVETEIKEPMLETCHVMKPSVMRQFGALLSVNLKRQLRVQSSFLSRIFVPVALLALIGVFSTVFSGSVMRRIDDPINSQMDILTTHSNIRTSDFGSTPLAAACVIDEQQKAFHTEHCEALALTRVEDGRQPIVIQKSPSQSMKEFVSQSSTREKLLQGLRMNGWIETDGSMTPCVVYYASSWLKNVSNKERAISVGVFIGADNRHATVHIYRRALSKVLKLFNFTDVENTTALSFVRPFGTSTIISLSMTAFFFAFSLFPVSFLNDPIEDMSSRVRSYLVSTGMSHLAYWINTFIMHWVQYAFFFLIAVTFLMISEAYRSAHLILTAFLPAYVFGTVSNLMTIYAVAVVTRTKSTVVSLCCDLFVAILPMAFIILNSPVALQLLIWLLPPAAPLGLLYCSTVYYFYKREFYQSTDTAALPGMPESIYQNPTILHSLVAMPVHIMIMCGVISMVENRHIIRGSLSTTSSTKAETMRPLNPDSDMDEGARMEAERVLGTPRNRKNVLEVRRLRQTHSNGVRAVRGVTFGAMAGEIFGLLGTNGAGKSTTMSVIVGEEAALEGVCEVYMHNYAWVSGREAATIGVIGYCPQHNPLFHSITVAEHLKFYADIRGLDSGESERQKNRLMISLGLAQYRDKQAGQLSGGNKRRLCLAIALLGNPSLVMIDEASTGVDPENKRSIWGAIRCMMHQQRSIIITTHSMEEVEALCSRVGIMNKGRIIAVGTVQQLRSLYGDEYTLELLLKSEAESAVQQKKKAIEKTVKEYFSGAQNQEDLGLGLVMQFSVPKSSVPSLSGALKWLEANQSRLGVSCWALCQMSLDQVFVKLVKKYDQSAQKLGIEARSGFST